MTLDRSGSFALRYWTSASNRSSNPGLSGGGTMHLILWANLQVSAAISSEGGVQAPQPNPFPRVPQVGLTSCNLPLSDFLTSSGFSCITLVSVELFPNVLGMS